MHNMGTNQELCGRKRRNDYESVVFLFVHMKRMISGILIPDVHIICQEIGTNFNS